MQGSQPIETWLFYALTGLIAGGGTVFGQADQRCPNPRQAWIGPTGGVRALIVTPEGDVVAGGTISSNFGQHREIWVAKLSAAGETLWTYRVGGIEPAGVNGAVVLEDDSLAIVGGFIGEVDFDPTEEVDVHTSATGHSCPTCETNAFLTKLASDGTYQWTRSFGWDGETSASASGLAYLSSSRRLVVVGRWAGGIDFDPGPDYVPPPDQDTNMYVALFDQEGVLDWVRTFGAHTASGPTGVQSDAMGNIFILGEFRGVLDLDPGPGTDYQASQGNFFDTFVSKLGADGSYVGAITYPVRIPAMAVFPDGSLVLAGRFSGTMDFDPTNANHLRSANGIDLFVTRLNPDWTHAWTFTVGTPEHEVADAVAIDVNGDILVAGTFLRRAGLDFDPGPGVEWRTCEPPAATCDFILRLTSEGEFVSVMVFQGPGQTGYPRSLVLDTEGNVYFTRIIEEGQDADPSCEVDVRFTQTLDLGKLTCDSRTGDFDGNGRVDLFDLAAFQNCFEGQGATTCNPGCDEFDLIPDNAIDLADFARLIDLRTGP